MSFQTAIAYHPTTDSIKAVTEVEQGLACACICEVCKAKLEAVHREKPNHNWFFRHSDKSNCKGGLESLLHRFAKQLITSHSSIVGLYKDRIEYISSRAETSLNPYRPDVTLALQNGENIFVEVFVSNEVKEIKKDFFVSNKFKSFEIDLSNFKDRNNLITEDNIKSKVLDDFNNRNKLYWPENKSSQIVSDNSIQDIAVGIFVFLGLRFIIKNIFNKRS